MLHLNNGIKKRFFFHPDVAKPSMLNRLFKFELKPNNHAPDFAIQIFPVKEKKWKKGNFEKWIKLDIKCRFCHWRWKKTSIAPKMNRTSIDDLMAGKLVCGRDLYESVSTNWWFRYEWHHFRAIHQSHSTSENVYSVSNNTHYFHISAYHSTKRHTKCGKNYRFMQFYADADFYRIAKKCAENRYFSNCMHTVFSLCFTWLHKFPLELSATFLSMWRYFLSASLEYNHE